MTKPSNKKTHEQFCTELKHKHPNILLIEVYKNTDTKIKYKCKHGEHSAYPWALLKQKHCCRTGYYDSKNMWKSKTLSLDEVKLRVLSTRKNVDVSDCFFTKHNQFKKINNIKCLIHNTYYSSFVSIIGICPKCLKNNNIEKFVNFRKTKNKFNKKGPFVSKGETKWLDSLNVNERQVWLPDIQYRVDGFDEVNKTVYLYHGKFWHGCPDTYDPEMIHPIIKIKMKELYEKTLKYEQKIIDAGYKLITKWE